MNLGPYILGPTDDEHQGIYIGDARELAKAIPDESVDLVFCDPVYDRIDDYRWLAETAARVLKPDRACLVWSSKRLAARCQLAMEQYLGYVYTLGYIVQAKSYRLNQYELFCWETPCLWMQKGMTRARWIPDTYIIHFSQIVKHSTHHKWDKDEGVISTWIEAFDSAVTVDFFTGGGTVPAACKMLGRHWIAFEIDPATAETARERVCNTQPPLFVPEPEQMELIT